MFQENGPHLIGPYPPVAPRPAVFKDDIDDGRLRREPGAADGTHRYRKVQGGRLPSNLAVHLFRAGGEAARTEAKTDLTGIASFPLPVSGMQARQLRLAAASEKVSQNVGHPAGPDVSVRLVPHAHGGSQHAASETGDLLHRKVKVPVGVFPFGNPELVKKLGVGVKGSSKMARRAYADLDEVTADRSSPEPGVERKRPRQVGRGDGRSLADCPQRRLGEPPLALLEVVKNRYQSSSGRSATGYDTVEGDRVEGAAHEVSPMQYRLFSPRR